MVSQIPPIRYRYFIYGPLFNVLYNKETNNSRLEIIYKCIVYEND